MKPTLGRSSLSLAYCLGTCLGIFVLFVPPASAQVNGPGPSPSSSFELVLNLPGDDAVISDGIGFSSGQTTQLNVREGGIVAGGFNVIGNSEVNISGGSVGGGFDARSGCEVNISGGTVGERFNTPVSYTHLTLPTICSV